jgi:phosphoglycolate phosphatase
MSDALRAHDSVIFDLDGTLWDTCDSIAAGWNRVLRERGIAFREVTGDAVRRVTGRPHEECVRTILAGVPEPELSALVDVTMDEDNRTIERDGGVLYPGVREGLHALAERYRLFIVSNCAAGYIEAFLRWSKLGELFEDHECWGNTRRPKGSNAQLLVRRNELRRPILVGDTAGDRDAARAARIPFIQVTYGFSDPLPGLTQAASFASLVELLGAKQTRI